MTESGRRGHGIVKVGIVTSDRMSKSVVVSVERLVKHPVYKRFVKRTTRFMAHDETQACKVGDTVEIVESRPLSARKRWRVRRIVTKGVRAIQPDELRRRHARGGRKAREASPADEPVAPVRAGKEAAGERP